MIISTSNFLSNATFTLTTGTLVDGALIDLKDTNFSYNLTTSGATTEITCGSTVATCSFVAVHGLRYSASTCDVAVYDGTTLITSGTTRSSNAVFKVSRLFTNLKIRFTNYGGQVTTSYISAGESIVIPNSGVRGGQKLPYFGYNYKDTVGSNQFAQPTDRLRERTAPSISLSIPTPNKTAFVRNELFKIFDYYGSYGHVSILDYEDDGFCGESWCAFDLSTGDVSAHGATTLLAPVKLSFKAGV